MISIPYIICSVLSFIPALVLHEVAHGFAAYKLKALQVADRENNYLL